tara:strand:- start:318 stop:749 length:432 start_codon:yes stop_codon:yes gene_type:complete
MESNLSLEQQAQVLAQQLKLLESYLEEINNREGMSMKAIIENKASIEAAKTFSKTSYKDALFPLGSGILVKIGNNPKFFLNIGAGVTIEKEPEQIIDFIENRIKDIQEGIKSLGVQKNELIQQYNNTRSELNNLVQQGNKNVR